MLVLKLITTLHQIRFHTFIYWIPCLTLCSEWIADPGQQSDSWLRRLLPLPPARGSLDLVIESDVNILDIAALAVIGVGWTLTWRRARRCRVDSACAAPSRLGIGLLGAATVLVLLALIWQPIIEPWALTLIRSAR